MVNREKRDLAVSLLKHFLACEITNDSFADAYPRDKHDVAIGSIYERLWGFWDDRHTHTLTGKYMLNAEARALFERCIAFLSSDLEYEWPRLEWRTLSQGLLRLTGMGRVADKRGREWTERVSQIGNIEVWPFIREEDLAQAPFHSQNVP